MKMISAISRPDTSAATHDAVYRKLRSRILYGEMPPGQSLTIRGIAAEFEVSMTPAREAVRRLTAEGALIMSHSGRVATPELTSERVEELAALRSLLEVELASRALPRAHQALITRLHSINAALGDIVSNGTPSDYIRSNLDFHRMLYLRAQAPAMLAMTENVWLQLGPTMAQLYAKQRRDVPPYYHRQILSALRDNDEAALRLAVRMDVTQGLRLLVN